MPCHVRQRRNCCKYELGLVVEDGDVGEDVAMLEETRTLAPYPPCPDMGDDLTTTPLAAKMEVLPLRLGDEPARYR